MDYEKAKRALVEFILSPVERLSQERQAQNDRLKKATKAKARLSSSLSFSYEVNLAAQAKQQLDETIAQRTHFS